MFEKLKNSFVDLSCGIGQRLTSLFSRKSLDNETIKKTEQLLLEADVGIKTTNEIISKLKKTIDVHADLDIQKTLVKLLQESLNIKKDITYTCYLLVGVNGSGKTTLAAKLAYHFQQQKHSPLLVAADTFRAAAVDQLCLWAKKIDADIISSSESKDPGSVVFDACTQFKQSTHDTLIIDTAGRLQTKANLMQELAKIKRIIHKQLPNESICTLLTIDATLGQNSIHQAKLFHEATQLDGIALTKYDSLAKAGTIFNISKEFSLPVMWISHGETPSSLEPFDPDAFCTAFCTE